MLHLNRIDTIFFDLDHTLWDFDKNSALTFERIFKEENLQLPLEEFLAYYVPINHYYWKLYRENTITQEQLRLLRLEKTFEKMNLSFSGQQLHRISEQYIDHLSTFPHLFEGTIPLLNHLQQQYELHLITNGFEKVQHYKVQNSGLAPYFKKVFTAEQVGYKKPHPKIFEVALEKTATQAENALMIGDSLEADILGAKAMGMQVLHFNSHAEPEHSHCPIVYSLKEMKALFH